MIANLRVSRLARALAEGVHVELRALDLGDEPLVLPADVAQELELVEHVSEARRLEHDAERLGGLGDVDLDDPPVEALRRDLVLAAKVDEPRRLKVEELVEPVEAALLQREHGLELVEPRLGGADLVLERADLLGDRLDLRAEHALALAGAIDLGFEVVDPGVDDFLALPDVLTGRRPRGGEKSARHGEGNDSPCHPQASFAGGSAVPPRPAGA